MVEIPRVELAPGYSIASIINGCWQLAPDHGGGPASRRQVMNRFAELVDHGFTTFDCADIYSGTEEALGEFRRSRTDRDNIQLHTKFVPNKGALAQLDNKRIDAAIDQSRQKLGVDQLDLVQFHWWDYNVPGLDRMYERLLYAQSVGRIRLLGATNFDTSQLRRLILQDASIVTMQAQYSLLDRRPDPNMQTFCLENDVGLLAYGVLAGGFLSDKYLDQSLDGDMNRSLQKYALIIEETGGWPAFQLLLALLDDIAKKHATTIHTIAARWVLDQPGVSAIVLGIGRRSRAGENLSISSVQLDADDRQRLSRQLASQPRLEGEPYELERAPDSRHYQIIKTELQGSAAP